jgi:flagellar hook protein FlgE
MSIVSALYAGASGLQTLGSSLQVVGNNIANVNTIGFKSSRASFADQLSQSLGGSALGSQVGRGVKLNGVINNFSQGAFSSTARITDLAISGNGFFMVREGAETYYTRDGQFALNNNGDLINFSGKIVQGYQYDNSGMNTGAIGDINLSNLMASPQATGSATISANLDAGAAVVGPFDINDPTATSNFSTSLSVYDSLGADHLVTVYFEKTGDNAWSWHAVADGSELTGGTAGTPQEIFQGTLTFTPEGQLDAVTQSTTAPFDSVDFANGAAPDQLISFDFGNSVMSGGTGLDGTTQFASSSAVVFQTQDGFAQGDLQAIDISENGVISGFFSNGRTRGLAQVALANFQNPEGLLKVGDNLYSETINAGLPNTGVPGNGSLGTIASSSLELSNVDLTNEFITMITNQRGFQANSRVITVGDELMQEVVNMV